MREFINVYKVFVGKHEGKSPVERPRSGSRILMSGYLRNMAWGYGLYSVGSGYITETVSYEDGY
jgi:hypothetical protein